IRRTGGEVDGRTVVAVVGLLLSARPPVPLSAQAFPTAPPKPTPLTPVRFPPFKEATLANGLQLVVIEHHEQPVVSVTLSFRAGGIYDAAGKEGLSALAAELLSKGTDSRRAVTRDDGPQFARQRLRPVAALLVIAGDVTDAQVRDLGAKAFAGWRGPPPPSPALPVPATRVATDILLVHRPGSAQANIALGNTTIPPTDPVYYPGRVATQVLGGGPDSRLFLILREQKSWTYGAYASLHRYRGLGYWQATAEVR